MRLLGGKGTLMTRNAPLLAFALLCNILRPICMEPDNG